MLGDGSNENWLWICILDSSTNRSLEYVMFASIESLIKNLIYMFLYFSLVLAVILIKLLWRKSGKLNFPLKSKHNPKF